MTDKPHILATKEEDGCFLAISEEMALQGESPHEFTSEMAIREAFPETPITFVSSFDFWKFLEGVRSL